MSRRVSNQWANPIKGALNNLGVDWIGIVAHTWRGFITIGVIWWGENRN